MKKSKICGLALLFGVFTFRLGFALPATSCNSAIATIDTAEVRKRPEFSSFTLPNYGKLSTDWAQEEIGAPEATEFLALYDKDHSGHPSSIVPVGILDGGFDLSNFPSDRLSSQLRQCKVGGKCDYLTIINPEAGVSTEATTSHGTTVAFLIAGGSDLSVGSKAVLSTLAALNADDVVIKAINTLGKSVIFNLSATPPTFLNQLNVLSVVAAGNYFPHSEGVAEETVNAILVGSLAPNGMISNFSNSDKNITISAPSDYYLQVQDGQNVVNFGGTSGAAPLVTAAISNVMSLLPGITSAEVTELINRTAIQTSGFINKTTQNGNGSLNAYKMVRVAGLLAAQWPSNRANLNTTATYDFDSEASDLVEKADALQASPSCADVTSSMKLLRQAFFLTQSNDVRQKLANTYKQRGLLAESQFYDVPSLSDSMLKQAALDRDFAQAAFDGNQSLASELLKQGASVNALSGSGKTALITAVDAQNLPMVQFLVGVTGVDLNVTDFAGDTALKVAENSGASQIVDVLKKSGAK